MTDLPNAAADAVSGTVSPDGNWIAFESQRNGNLDIFAARIDGSETLNLSNHTSDDFSPFWSIAP